MPGDPLSEQGAAMFESNAPELWRKYTQQDLLAATIRVGLSLTGPLGAIAAEFITEFIPQQRIDRLTDFVEKLAEVLKESDEQFKERLSSSNGFAALAEQVAVSAVRTASTDHRADLAELLKHGLSSSEAEMLEEQALLSLRDRINDAQVLLLMNYSNFKPTLRDGERSAFQQMHSGLFSINPPPRGSSTEDQRRWTMREHYESELATLGLLRDTEGIAKSGPQRKYEITSLGRLLLQAIGRYRDPMSAV